MHADASSHAFCAASEGSAEAGSSSSAPLPDSYSNPGPASLAAANLPLQLRLMRRVEQTVTLFSLLLQLALYYRMVAVLTLRQHLHQAALLLLRVVCLLAATCLPTHLWLKYRVVLIGAFRIAIATMPSQRTARDGDAVLLDRPASGGSLGCLQDFLRVICGTRLLPMALIGAVLHQPPLAVLVQQTTLLVLTSHNRGFCDSRLLTHRLMRRRIAALWRALEAWTPLLAPPPAPAAARLAGLPPGDCSYWLALAGWSWWAPSFDAILPSLWHLTAAQLALRANPAGPAGQELLRVLQCVAVLNWTQAVLGVVLPVVAASLTAPAAPPQAPPCDRRFAIVQQSRAKSAVARVHRLGAAVAASIVRLDAALQDCCRLGGLARLKLVPAVALLIANMWPLAKAAAERSLLLPPAS